ncbi:MAG TPA: glycosyltransferase [Kiritimatiellia bacterium]|nr:glycosyltransferase [Kiritimatiellia bacterium]
MKLAYLLNSLSRANGGISESVRRLAQSIQTLGGATPSVYALHDEFAEADAPTWRPVRARAFPIRGPRALGYSPRLRNALAADAPDLLHTAGLWMYPSVAALQRHRRAKTPVIVSPHGMLDAWALRNSAWKKRLAAMCYERAHLESAACLHALCASEADSIRAFGLKRPICVLPNGVDLPGPPPAASVAAPWNERIAAGTPVMLFLGRLHPKKGLVPLLEAWRETRGAGWHLAIAGWDQGGHRAELERLTKHYELDACVTFLGPLHGAQKDAALRSAQAFVLPSFSEGLPITVLEAWAYGVPVLMTPACNLPAGFSAGAAVELSTEPDKLARALLSFFQMPESARAEMSARGRDLAASEFNWAEIARKMLSVYRWIAGEAPMPDFVQK